MTKQEIPVYKDETKNFVVKDVIRILKLNKTQFLYELSGLYGRTWGFEYRKALPKSIKKLTK